MAFAFRKRNRLLCEWDQVRIPLTPPESRSLGGVPHGDRMFAGISQEGPAVRILFAPAGSPLRTCSTRRMSASRSHIARLSGTPPGSAIPLPYQMRMADAMLALLRSGIRAGHDRENGPQRWKIWRTPSASPKRRATSCACRPAFRGNAAQGVAISAPSYLAPHSAVSLSLGPNTLYVRSW